MGAVVPAILTSRKTYQEATHALAKDLQDATIMGHGIDLNPMQETSLEYMQDIILRKLRNNPARPITVLTINSSKYEPLMLRLLLFLVQERGQVALAEGNTNITEITIY